MNNFLDCKFLGIKPFTEVLNENNIDYILFDDKNLIDNIFIERSDFINKDDDKVSIGKCLNKDIEVYFVQCGIKITKSYLTFIVFIYDHHPSFADMLNAIDSMPDIVNQSLDNIDMSKFT